MIVTQRFDPAYTLALAVVIDIDVFFEREHDPTPDNLRRSLEILRSLKNRTFFSLLTDETVKLFE